MKYGSEFGECKIVEVLSRRIKFYGITFSVDINVNFNEVIMKLYQE